MYYDDKKFTALERNFLKAFEQFNIKVLQECLEAGMDINANPDKKIYSPSVLSEALDFLDEDKNTERYENWDYGDIDVKAPVVESDRIRFLKFCIEKGIDLNACDDDCGEIISLAFEVNRYCYDLDVVKFILGQKNINLNTMVRENVSLLDFAGEHIFCDERGSQAAMSSYYQERLLTYYGAKPASLLNANFSEKQKELYEKLFSLNVQKIKEISKEDFLEYKLDSVLIDWARYYYPELWYCETEEFELRMISVFKEILEKIGAENFSSNVLYECVCQKLPLLLEFLLKKGVDPNVNCFNSYFSWVKSSALYEIQDEGSYFSDELCQRMEDALVEAGAKFS